MNQEWLDELRKENDLNWNTYRDQEKFAISNTLSTMHNLALFCGAFAAGALVLLGADIQADKLLVLIGILILAVNIFIIFAYLLHSLGTNTKSLREIRTYALFPVDKVLIAGTDFLSGKITQNTLDDIIIQAKESSDEFGAKITQQKINPKRDIGEHIEVPILGLLGTGVVLIGIGLLSLYFPLLNL